MVKHLIILQWIEAADRINCLAGGFYRCLAWHWELSFALPFRCHGRTYDLCRDHPRKIMEAFNSHSADTLNLVESLKWNQRKMTRQWGNHCIFQIKWLFPLSMDQGTVFLKLHSYWINEHFPCFISHRHMMIIHFHGYCNYSFST